DLKSKMDRMALESKRDQKDVSRALESAADTLRGRRTEEKLRYSQREARNAQQEWMKSFEPMVSSDITDLAQRVAQPQAAAPNRTGQREQAQAADKARDLVRGLESLDERMRQRAEQNGNQRRLSDQGQQGQQSQQGQQGQQGQQNQQGQQGQQGQQNQQGQKG